MALVGRLAPQVYSKGIHIDIEILNCINFNFLIFNSAYAITNGQLLELSDQNLLDCTYDSTRDGCGGGWPHEALNYVITNAGIETKSSYPYKLYAQQSDAYVSIMNKIYLFYFKALCLNKNY